MQLKDLVLKGKQEIDTLSINDIHGFKARIKAKIAAIDSDTSRISESRRKRLRGHKRALNELLHFADRRIKLLKAESLAIRFMKVAEQELPIRQFQKIYGLAASVEDNP